MSEKKTAGKKLFGTDGIRGLANQFPVTPDIALKLGQALGRLLKRKYKGEKRLTVLIGKDTRLSGYMLEQALASGLNSMGLWVQLTGPLPTPGIGFLAQSMRVSAGLVISASHNPYRDNGIKIFFADGFKISSEEEREIEEMVFSGSLGGGTAEVGRTRRIVDAAGRYIVFAKGAFPKSQSLKGMRMILDCANGAAYKAAPAIFRELGAEVLTMGTEPDGFNINKDSGALFPEKMAAAVLREKADLGLSLDGDGDRAIMADEKGRILNGDHILGICAIHLKGRNALTGSCVAATYLSGSGLEETLMSHGIRMVRTDIGDRNVVQIMREQNISLGGESSGHVIFLSRATTGDGCIAALSVLAAMKIRGEKLSALRDMIKEIPQISLKAPFKKKRKLEALEGYGEAMRAAEKRLGQGGRILARFSGTEPVLRVFAEGQSKKTVEGEARRLLRFLQSRLS